MDNDPAAELLNGLSDHVDRGFVPVAETFVALRRLNAALARLCAKHSIVIRDDGLAYSAPRGEAGLGVVDEDEPA